MLEKILLIGMIKHGVRNRPSTGSWNIELRERRPSSWYCRFWGRSRRWF